MISFLSRFKIALVNFQIQESGRRWVSKDRKHFVEGLKVLRPDWHIGNDHFCPFDKTKETGFDRHYVYHPAWAFRKVMQDIRPTKHVDISSILHFSAQLSAVLPVEFYDYRPPLLECDQLKVGSVNLNQLPFEDSSISSLSCMHTIEHVGLGRYGDKLDPDGDLKSLKELERVVNCGGSLLLVVPVGEHSVVHFNAHRVYQPEWIVKSLKRMHLEEFFYIQGRIGSPKVMRAEGALMKGETYGCGCFWFKKLK